MERRCPDTAEISGSIPESPTICEHRYPEDICWNCHPEILEELKRIYPPNLEKLKKMADRNPSLKELYQDVQCIGVSIDWDTVFEIAQTININTMPQ